MKALDSKQLTVNVVEDHKLSAFAKSIYGHDPEMVATEEWPNDTQHLYKNIDGRMPDKWEMKEWEEFLDDGTTTYGIAQLILNALVRDGHIAEGNYLITVSW